ncbi:MAG: DUF1566 domain-containing protein [Planctomycetes bacterium]|nr:DUF1566 domain-containing protein [Planctomycetota bacterium]
MARARGIGIGIGIGFALCFALTAPWDAKADEPRYYTVPGDVNGDGSLDIGDAVHLLNYLFAEGEAPAVCPAGCSNADRFLDNGDGTVTDTLTRLMWAQAPSPSTLTQEGAIQYCEALELGGRDDWRAPTMEELVTLIRYDRTNPAIDPIFEVPMWPCVVNDCVYAYWSSTPVPSDAGKRWGVFFNDGALASAEVWVHASIRAVRCGP